MQSLNCAILLQFFEKMDNRYVINLKDVIENKKDLFFKLEDKIKLENTVLSREGIIVDFNLSGRASPAGSDVFIEMEFTGVVYGTCGKCACDASVSMSTHYEIVASRDSGKYELEDFVLIKGTEVEIYQLVVDTIILSLPMTLICSPNCRGLCPDCGVNLNIKDCGCKKSMDKIGFNMIEQKFKFKNGGD